VKFKASELATASEGNIEDVLGELADRKVDYNKWFEASGYIGRSNIDRYKMEFKLYEFPGSKSAKSYILPVNDNQILIKIVTGRMHQIRATLYYYGYYIDGDLLYSPRGKCSSEKIMLESIYLSFIHPVTQKRMFFINK
jgi:23S rRNA-/tRNA-specific pseudouridylate synthase